MPPNCFYYDLVLMPIGHPKVVMLHRSVFDAIPKGKDNSCNSGVYFWFSGIGPHINFTREIKGTTAQAMRLPQASESGHFSRTTPFCDRTLNRENVPQIAAEKRFLYRPEWMRDSRRMHY
jgi:hypothetical protein